MTADVAAGTVIDADGASLRVLIVDDSVVARAVLGRIVDEATGLRVVAACASAGHALAWLEHDRADVILLDLEMPGRSGLVALPDLLRAGRGARILVVSSAASEGTAVALEALSLGAVDTIVKPTPADLGRDFGFRLVEKIERIGRAMRQAHVVRPIGLRPPSIVPLDVLAIGGSTGGIEALAAFFRALPPQFAAPILVTQHLPSTFMTHLANQLSLLSGRQASVAIDGERLRRSEIYIAPGDAHLTVTGLAGYARVALTHAPTPTRCCPSVDVMIASLAAHGSGAAAVVLSGMGRDGLEGARTLAAADGTVLAQDEASSTIWGMPGGIARAGLATAVAPPTALAEYIGQRGSR